MAEVIQPALDHAGVPAQAIDGIFVGCMNNGFSRQDFQAALPGMIAQDLATKPAVRLENACATGSAALYAALDFIAAGRGGEVALVVGVEKMTALPTAEVGGIFCSAPATAQKRPMLPAGLRGCLAVSRRAISRATAINPRRLR